MTAFGSRAKTIAYTGARQSHSVWHMHNFQQLPCQTGHQVKMQVSLKTQKKFLFAGFVCLFFQ